MNQHLWHFCRGTACFPFLPQKPSWLEQRSKYLEEFARSPKSIGASPKWFERCSRSFEACSKELGQPLKSSEASSSQFEGRSKSMSPSFPELKTSSGLGTEEQNKRKRLASRSYLTLERTMNQAESVPLSPARTMQLPSFNVWLF